MTTAAPSNLWDDLLALVRVRHPALARSWFTDLTLEGITHGVMTIRTANAAQHQYLEQYGLPGFAEAAQAVTGRLVTVTFLSPLVDPTALVKKLRGESLTKRLRLNPENTLENFVVGPCNRLAHAAAVSVTDLPGQSYNPLFLHGPPGSGKTHLLHAIGQRLLEQNPSAKIICLPCSNYVNHVMAALELDASTPLHSRWRDADALLLDNVDFLADRQRSQEDFFHLFNALMENGIQIVLTANVPPSEIADLPARLVSRFSSGLVALMEPPCLETRIAIVRKRAERRAVVLPEPVVALVAEHVPEGLHTLDAVLANLDLAGHRQSGRIDAALTREVLGVKHHNS